MYIIIAKLNFYYYNTKFTLYKYMRPTFAGHY